MTTLGMTKSGRFKWAHRMTRKHIETHPNDDYRTMFGYFLKRSY